MSKAIKLNNEEIRIRPSAIDNFFTCSYQWGKVFLEGVITIPNSRAAIGTSVHRAAEVMWQEAMKTGQKDANLSMMTDAAMEAWKEETANGMQYGDGENPNSCAVEIVKGTEAFVEDIVPWVAIPTGVEEFVSVELDNPIVKEIGGTIDYINAKNNTISDIKTSKRAITPSKHTTQQSIYKYLANANGYNIQHNTIQGIVFKSKSTEGTIQRLEPNEEEAKARVNIILDTMDLIAKDVAPIEQILRPNPGHYLCSKKFCSLYPCHAIKEN